MADFSYIAPNGVGQQGTTEPGIQGGIQQIPFRNMQDAQLSGFDGFVPSAEYPSGYIGTIQSRREDRFLDNLKNQLNQRSYQRGVHKGEKINPTDYFWPSELTELRGLAREAQVTYQPDNATYASPRNAPLGTPLEQMMASGGTQLPVGPRGRMQPPPAPGSVNPAIAANLRYLSPSWR